MPLRDHFHPPTDNIASWEELHGQWPATLVQHLKTQLPEGYVAAPRVHSGSQIEVDVATYERDDAPSASGSNADSMSTAPWASTTATLTLEPDALDFDEYEVRIYDAKRARQLVAAIEIVSPANKDRLEHRNAFVAKCAALLQKGVAVSIVDLVTTRQFNLYTELLTFLDQRDPSLPAPPPHTYATSCRWLKQGKKMVMQVRFHELSIGQPLPILPLWLAPNRVVALELEQSYEQACHDLSIP